MWFREFDDVFEKVTYPAGETHIRFRTGVCMDGYTILAEARDFTDLCNIVVADRVAKRHGVSPTWFVPYFPFARDDRRNTSYDGEELHLAMEMVKEIDIIIADPHSDVAGHLPHIPQSSSVSAFIGAGLFNGDPVIMIPDQGATKKAYSWTGMVPDCEVVQAGKVRDTATGNLSGFRLEVPDSFSFDNRPVVIVDDICDGGGTFLGLADEVIDQYGAGELRLGVTHGLFTRGVACLLDRFEMVMSFSDRPGPSYAGRAVHISWQELYAVGERV